MLILASDRESQTRASVPGRLSRNRAICLVTCMGGSGCGFQMVHADRHRKQSSHRFPFRNAKFGWSKIPLNLRRAMGYSWPVHDAPTPRDVRRRWFGAFFLAIAAGMVIWGQMVLEPYLKGFWFML